jgi:hypothetical protein
MFSDPHGPLLFPIKAGVDLVKDLKGSEHASADDARAGFEDRKRAIG